MRLFKIILIGIICLISLNSSATTNAVLDNRAKKLPYSQGQSVQSIVQNLTSDLNSDLEKARILASFVAFQLDRNGYAERELEQSSQQNKPAQKMPSNDILKTRIGTSQEYAILYKQLCTAAGLNVVKIDGYAGNNIQSPDRKDPAGLQAVRHSVQQLTGLPDYRMQQYESSWNAVQIDDRWILVDTYRMIFGKKSIAKDITSHKEMIRFLKQREREGFRGNKLSQGKRIDEDYFNAKPNQFIKTHYPLNPKWQLLPVPVTWHSFLR